MSWPVPTAEGGRVLGQYLDAELADRRPGTSVGHDGKYERGPRGAAESAARSRVRLTSDSIISDVSQLWAAEQYRRCASTKPTTSLVPRFPVPIYAPQGS